MLAQRHRLASLSELARAVGISRQALYLHFPDRAAALAALASPLSK